MRRASRADALALAEFRGNEGRYPGAEPLDLHRLSPAWAAALHCHPSAVDGIFCPSRRLNDLYSVALFDRARDAVRFERWGVLGDWAVPDLWAELGRVVDRWQIRLLPFPPKPADPSA